MTLASSMEHKVDFQIYQTPPFIDHNNADALPPKITQDSESSVVENDANQPLYNAEIYGSLRKGGAVNFFSKKCVGLVAATFASAFSVECLNCVINPMLKKHFSLKPAKLAASQRLTSIPLAFCFFFGLVSDCYPILGFRRKGYLMIGLATTALSLFVLSALDGYIVTLEEGTAGTGLAATIILFATLASTGNMVTDMCVHTRVLELSQREKLIMRGAIIATYSIFRFLVCIITDACAYAFKVTKTKNHIALIAFGLVIGISIPLVWKAWQEKYYSLSTPMKTRGQILWKVMQQKAVWRILLFMCLFTLFGTITFSLPTVIIAVWSGASGDERFVLQLMYYGAVVLTIAVWRYYFMNRPWRIFFAMSTVLLIVPQVILAVVVSKDIIRNRFFYRFMTLFLSIADGISWLARVVPLTEIIQEGSEGAMVGLMLSTYYLVSMFVETNATGLFTGTNFYNTVEIVFDKPDGRSGVLKALLINYAINALQFTGLFFLPRQKLDTQQLRSYGGYTKCTSAAIVAFALMFFVYTVTVTAFTLNPSTSCMDIAGGDGC
ncbi:unnamed protein product [Peronospora belbahrii]|uniref:Transmembrane protein n=1 Tax=Peronospora belbahrii TaxID=622444 RepID=A0AAU9KNV4_9STRA|nr:unnamed protein product [Peronospora belbahrii]CAH0516880.1 unnamed protein product [Peronospora belbahrii]